MIPLLPILYLSIFSDHFSVTTYNYCLQEIFPDDSSMPTILVLVGGLSFGFSCLFQGYILRRFPFSFREIICLNLVINGLSVLISANLPVDGVLAHSIWIILRFLANILSSELYAPFFIQNMIYKGKEDKRFMANLGNLSFQCLANISSVVMILCDVKEKTAIMTSASFCLLASVVIFISLSGKEDDQGKVSTFENITKYPDHEEQKSPASSSPDEIISSEENGHKRLWDCLKDPEWILLGFFIFFRLSLTGIIQYKAFIELKKDFKLPVKGFSILQLIFSVSNIVVGMLLSIPSAKINHNGLKIGIPTIISATLTFFYGTVEKAGFQSVTALVCIYFAFDFCINVLTLAWVSDYSIRQDQRIAPMILTGTLSLLYFGGVFGAFLASLSRTEINFSIGAIAILLSVIIVFFRK